LILNNITAVDLTGVNVIGLNASTDTIVSDNAVSKLFLDDTAPKASVFC